MTFKEFLALPRKWGRYQRLFVQDALADRTLPDITSLDAMLDHMPRRLGPGLRDEARIVWQAYQTALGATPLG